MFWDNFYSACLKKGTKPNPLAKELQIASGSMTAWKGGKLPNGETLLKIADYLDVSVDYLLGRTDEPNSTFIKSGDINGDNNSLTDSNNINISKKSTDGISEKFMEIFNNLPFEQQLAVMNFAVEKSKNKE